MSDEPLPIDAPNEHHAVLEVEYDGTPYHGWARQPDHPSIEAELLAAFARLRLADVRLCCAGRTDAGVHATAQVIDARYTGRIAPDTLARALDSNLPPEIATLRSAVAPAGFDARADATSRAYEYRVLPRRGGSPLRVGRVLHHPRRLDRAALEEVAALALGQHDFRAFTKTRTAHEFFHRTVITSRWIERGDELVYEIRANAFLRHMVRVLVGTMLSVARGENTVDQFRELLDGAPRADAFQTAPPHALCLVDVTWEPIDGVDLPPRWRQGHAPELREPAAFAQAALPFSSAG